MKKIFLLLAVLSLLIIKNISWAQESTASGPTLYPCFLIGDIQYSPFGGEICGMLDRGIATAFSASIYGADQAQTLDDALTMMFKAAGLYDRAMAYGGACPNDPLVSFAKAKAMIKNNICNPGDQTLLRSSTVIMTTRLWFSAHYADYVSTRDSYNGPDLSAFTFPFGIARDYFKFAYMKGALQGIDELIVNGVSADSTYGSAVLTRDEATYIIGKIFGVPARDIVVYSPENGDTTPEISGLPDPNPVPVEETPPTSDPEPVTPENFSWENVTDITDHPLENYIVDLIESDLTDVTASQATFRPDEPQTLNESLAMLTKKYGVYERASTYQGQCATEPLMSYALAAGIIKTGTCPVGSNATTRGGLIVMDYRFMNKYKLAEYKAVINSYDGPTLPSNLYTPYGIATDAFKLAYMKGALVDLDIGNRSQTDYNYGRASITRAQGASILDGLLDIPHVVTTPPVTLPPPPPPPTVYPWRLDTDFGDQGYASVQYTTSLMATDHLNRIVTVEDSGDIYLKRYLPTGEPDPGFATATNGQIRLNFPGSQHPSYITIDSRNRIIVVGTTADSEGYNDIFVSRITEYGELDRSFNYYNFGFSEIFAYQMLGSNIYINGILNMHDYPKGVIVDSRGNIIIAATSVNATQPYNMATITSHVYCLDDNGRYCGGDLWKGGGHLNRTDISVENYDSTIVSNIYEDSQTGDYTLLGNVGNKEGNLYQPFIATVYPDGRKLDQPYVYSQTNSNSFMMALDDDAHVFAMRNFHDETGYYMETTVYRDYYYLDTAFNNSGARTTLIAPAGETGFASKIIPDGEGGFFAHGTFSNGYYVASIIALFFADITHNGDAFIAHVLPNGQPDSLFGTEGKIAIDQTDSDRIVTLSMDDEGDLLAFLRVNESNLIKFTHAAPVGAPQ